LSAQQVRNSNGEGSDTTPPQTPSTPKPKIPLGSILRFISCGALSYSIAKAASLFYFTSNSVSSCGTCSVSVSQRDQYSSAWSLNLIEFSGKLYQKLSRKAVPLTGYGILQK
jgi:hypothetical protein